MKKVLVPTDFSPCADKALYFATTIAQKANAEILLLHVSDELYKGEPEGLRTTTEDTGQPVTQTVQARLQQLAQQTTQHTGLPVTPKIDGGNLTDSIQNAINEHGIDLIVMGTQGASGFKKKILGSNTAATISQIKIPVLSIPGGYTGNSIKEILLALKSTEENLSLVEPAFELQTLFGAKLRLAIYTGTKDEAATYIDDRRTITNIQYRLHDKYGQQLEAEHISGNDFQETLQQFVLAKNIDLLVMVTHTRSAIENLFHRSMTRQMSYHSTIPLLSLHA